MTFGEVVLKIREDNGLSQSELADRVHVTSQAVSRWERSETVPTLDTLCVISETFRVDAAALLGLEETPVCQSCAMPLRILDDFGTNTDETPVAEYCAHCFRGGAFTNNRTIEETAEANLYFLAEFNAENGTEFSEKDARTVMLAHLAALKRWKKA
ncbi:MAG: helix-turn-helix domain-containing protein [Oscillospiraceae bacterium]|nr:helix-turn-helix domain-containing protein [Oscillospiraceae bacterium]